MAVAYFNLRRDTSSRFHLHDLYLSSWISSGYLMVLIKLTVYLHYLAHVSCGVDLCDQGMQIQYNLS